MPYSLDSRTHKEVHTGVLLPLQFEAKPCGQTETWQAVFMDGVVGLWDSMWDSMWDYMWNSGFICVKEVVGYFWREEIYFTNCLLLRVWPIFVVNFVAQKPLINNCMEIRFQGGLVFKAHRHCITQL